MSWFIMQLCAPSGDGNYCPRLDCSDRAFNKLTRTFCVGVQYNADYGEAGHAFQAERANTLRTELDNTIDFIQSTERGGPRTVPGSVVDVDRYRLYDCP